MNKNIFFSILVMFSLVVGYGVFYDGWFKFIPSTAALIILTYFFYPDNYKQMLGINWNKSEVFNGIMIFLFFLAASFFVIKFSLPEGYFLKISEPIEYIVVPFQTLNEELVFRGLLLSSLLRLGWKKWYAILLPAFVFSILHWAFYSYNLVSSNRGSIDLSALIALIFFAMTMNLMFIHTKSVILPWAIHFAWNTHQFGSRIIQKETGDSVQEYLVFNILVGSNAVLLLSLILFILSFNLLRRKLPHLS